MADAVMSRNEGVYVEAHRLIMERHGYQEETYYTFSYSPVPNDAGGRGGLICANTDDTRRVIGERQLATLRELAAATANARSRDEACARSIDALAGNERDVPFALLYAVDPGGSLRLAASSTGAEALHDPVPWTCGEVAQTGALRIVPLPSAAGAVPRGAWPRAPFQAAVVPISGTGPHAHAGVLVVGLNPFRQFDDSYEGFLDLAAGQVAAAISNADAYDQERRRAEALAELDRAKTAFFSNVSHEFRTPLTLMMGPLEDMLAAADTLSAEDRSRVEVAYRNSARLLKLVNTLLDFSSLESGRLQAFYEPTDLAALTADLASVFRSAVERAGLRLTIDCAPIDAPVHVDRDMWEKVIFNLLSNALKFTFEGEIAVVLRQDGDRAVLAVRDTGTGIPAAELPNVFQRFHRVRGARGRSIEGSGIGLALVQELVKLHGGEVAVASESGAGTTFTVSIPVGTGHLPLTRPDAARAPLTALPMRNVYVDESTGLHAAAERVDVAPAPAAGEALPRPRVLVAEDNADMQHYVRRLLAPRYDVQTVPDGNAALAAARTRPPDLVLTDVMMPGLDGFGLLAALRADPALRGVPVIMLSARAGEEARVEGMQAGADDYLVKPFGARELLARVDARLELGRLQARVAEERRAFASLFAQSPVATAVLRGDDLVFEAANDAYRAIVGGRDIVGKPLLVALPELGGQALDSLLREVMATGRPYIERERPVRLERDGALADRFFTFIFAPLRDTHDRIDGVIAVCEEVTHEVRARETLRDADRRKDEFLATLSHELRNPLAPLRSSLQLLRLARDTDAPTLSRDEIYGIMERQVEHLVRLVDDLMEVSRINRGVLELRKERVDLVGVLRAALEGSAPLVTAAGHRLNVTLPDAPLWVDGDAVRLSQIVGNLVNNAAKYTDPGGEIAVDARAVDGEAVVSVRDTGVGIEAAALPQLFEMFSRGERRRSGRQDGLGIGLALSRKLAQMHGGDVTGTSDGIGRGSTFVVRLPLIAADAPAAPPVVAAPHFAPGAGSRARVLVADDNADAADTLGMLLDELGADVCVVHDGAAAIEAFASYAPRIAILDIGMPDMDGYEVARRLRAAQPDGGTIIVALTGWGQQEDRRRAREAGFDHHLVKPVGLDTLQRLLASLSVAEDQAAD